MRLMSAAPRGVAAKRRSSATTCGRRLVIASSARSASVSVNVRSSPAFIGDALRLERRQQFGRRDRDTVGIDTAAGVDV